MGLALGSPEGRDMEEGCEWKVVVARPSQDDIIGVGAETQWLLGVVRA